MLAYSTTVTGAAEILAAGKHVIYGYSISSAGNPGRVALKVNNIDKGGCLAFSATGGGIERSSSLDLFQTNGYSLTVSQTTTGVAVDVTVNYETYS